MSDGDMRVLYLQKLFAARLDYLPREERREVFNRIRQDMEEYIERRIMEDRDRKIRRHKDEVLDESPAETAASDRRNAGDGE